MQKSKFLNLSLLVFVILAVVLGGITTTLAYFRYSTYFFGEGTLPLLKLYSNTNITGSTSLKRITYVGQAEESVNVSFNTNGNNVAGKLRVIITYVWQDNLNNKPINEENEQVISIQAKLSDTSSFRVQNDYEYYMNANFEPNTVVNFISGVQFGNLPSEYLGKYVDIYIIADLIQLNKEW